MNGYIANYFGRRLVINTSPDEFVPRYYILPCKSKPRNIKTAMKFIAMLPTLETEFASQFTPFLHLKEKPTILNMDISKIWIEDYNVDSLDLEHGVILLGDGYNDADNKQLFDKVKKRAGKMIPMFLAERAAQERAKSKIEPVILKSKNLNIDRIVKKYLAKVEREERKGNANR